MRNRGIWWRAAVTAGWLACATALPAQSALPAPPWTFRSSLFLTGGSDHSTPIGYQVYSAIGLAVGLDRQVARRLVAALTVRPESREVDLTTPQGVRQREGSLDLVVTDLTLRYQPGRGSRGGPYAGAGVSLMVAWEKSGTLDTLDIAPHVGLALEAGVDVPLSDLILFNVELGWNGEQVSLDSGGEQLAEIDIDPLVLSVGLGFRF